MTSQASSSGEAPVSDLAQVADQLGICTRYVTAWGEAREIPAESIKALVRAQGLPAGSALEVSQTRAQLQEDARAQPLPRVVVLEEGRDLTLPLSVPCEWSVALETGTVRTGLAAKKGATVSIPTATLPPGYHTLEIAPGEGVSSPPQSALIIVPTRAYAPPGWSRDQRMWALTVQLYSLRSARNWGIGDFTDLGALMREAAQQGATAVGLNPLHALFPTDASRLSPYSPSSRLFLNPIYLDVEAVPEFAGSLEATTLFRSEAFQTQLKALRDRDHVDYAQVGSCKQRILELLHRDFLQRHLSTTGNDSRSERGQAFLDFRRDRGQALEDLACFEALQSHFAAQGLSTWHQWPSPYQDARSPEVKRFAEAHPEALSRSVYLQWETDRQLRAAARAGPEAGLYQDVAVGVSPDGAEAWADPSLLIPRVSIGAPPDVYNPKGQDWGLAPMSPRALQARAYAPFIAAIRANMRHAAVMRLDHVIGLQRLWWIPAPEGAAGGAYVQYPLADLIGIVALESHRHRCIVVGEDLGTVPEGFREEMQRRGILSYRLLMFERAEADARFLPPSSYPELAAVAVSTHDLATLRGFWSETDLDVRQALRLFPSAEKAQKAKEERHQARGLLAQALQERGLLSGEAASSLIKGPLDEAAYAQLAAAAHAYLAQTPSRLLLVQLEDLLGQQEQMNLPGTVHEHPNWRRKLKRPLETLFQDVDVLRLIAAIRPRRGRGR